MASSSSTLKSSRTTEERSTEPSGKRFYGHADNRNGGLFSTLKKLTSRKLQMDSDCNSPCNNLEKYKTCCDKLHQALMYVLVENASLSKNLGIANIPNKVEIDRTYLSASEFLKTFEKLQNKQRKGAQESLEPAVNALHEMYEEYEKYVRKQLKTLLPLTEFIGIEYWEYAKLRKTYYDTLEQYDAAVTQESKERTKEAEVATEQAKKARNEAKDAMLSYIAKIKDETRLKQVACVIKFSEDAVLFHKKMTELLSTAVPKDMKESKE